MTTTFGLSVSRIALLRLATALGATALGLSGAGAAEVTYERLVKPEPGNWLMNHHDYGSHRFSALDAINKGNVKNLKLAFAVPLGGSSRERIHRGNAAGGGRLSLHHRRLERGLQDRRPLRHRRPRGLENGPRHRQAGSQPRRRAVGQFCHLGHRPRRAGDRDRQGNRQGGVGQEPAATSPTSKSPRRRSR